MDKNDSIPRKNRNKSKDPPRSHTHPWLPERDPPENIAKTPPVAIARKMNSSSKSGSSCESDGDDCRDGDMEEAQANATFGKTAYNTAEDEKECGKVQALDNKDTWLHSRENLIKFKLDH